LTRPHFTALVDDDEAIREAVVDLLESVGLSCISFESAEQYLLDPRRADVRCLILDVNLPGMSGLELHRQIVEAHDLTPVLFLTSVDDPSVQERAMQLGASVFFSKPVDSALLLSGIQNCLMDAC
jgi:FixJ family two-component response regulator